MNWKLSQILLLVKDLILRNWLPMVGIGEILNSNVSFCVLEEFRFFEVLVSLYDEIFSR
jgi:hypothetical protein